MVRLCREHHGCDFETGKEEVLAAIAKTKEPA
jgi:hypothetical protein